MRLFYIKPSLAVLIYAFFISALFVPELSYAYYGGRHHSSYSRHHGHGHSRHSRFSRHYGYGHSRHYGYKRYGRKYNYSNHYYRRNRYSYPRQRYYQSYSRSYSLAAPAAVNVYSNYKVNRQSSADYSGINSSAWQTLSQGQYSDALNVFANEAQSHPNSGVPKAGYALATAATGDLERGVWAMHRAFRIDPDSLHYVKLDKTSHRLLDNLIAQYSHHKNNNLGDQDFMISALHYLKHDYLAAKKSITAAQSYGNNNSSIFNLNKLIDQQLATGQQY